MTPDDPRYHDTDFDNTGCPVVYAEQETCELCGEEDDDIRECDDDRMCVNCYNDLPICAICEEKFVGESLDGLCSQECREIANEEGILNEPDTSEGQT